MNGFVVHIYVLASICCYENTDIFRNKLVPRSFHGNDLPNTRICVVDRLSKIEMKTEMT